MRNAVVPGQRVFIPPGPEESQKHSAGGNHVAEAAQQHLARRGRFTGEARNLQAAEHHAWRGTTEDGEESEILQIDDGERRTVDLRAQLAQRELAAERAEQRQEATVSEEEA